MKRLKQMPPVSPSGFLLGALLAAAAVAVKILFLQDVEERRTSAGKS